jgi:cell division protein FtsQ
MTVAAPADKRFRRGHVSPARGRAARWRRRLIVTGLAAAAAMYAVYVIGSSLLATEALTVSKITVNGNAKLSRGEVLALLDDLRGRNMLFVNLEEYRQRLLASPWVADAALRRALPGTIDVLVSEREPLGIARLRGGLYLLDERGAVIDEFGPNNAALDLPVIDGLAAAKSGSTATAIDPHRAQLAVRLLESLQARPDLAGRISQVDVTDARDAVVMLKGDIAMIRVGDDQFAERLQSYLDLAPALKERVPSIDYVDLRFGERVYVRPQN